MSAAVEIIEPPTPRLPDAGAMPAEAPAELELAVVLRFGASQLTVATIAASDLTRLADLNDAPTAGAVADLLAQLRARGVRYTRAGATPASPKPERQGGGHRALRQKRNTVLDRVLARLREGPATAQELIEAGICRHAAHVRGCVQYLRAKKGCDIRLIDGAYALVAEGQKEKS